MQQELSRRGAIDSDRIVSIAVPIPSDGLVAGRAEGEDDIRKADRVGVSQIKAAIAIDANRGIPIPIPIANHRIIAWQSIIDLHIRKPSGIAVLQV